MLRIKVTEIIDYGAEIFARVGCAPEEARRVATSLVDANLTGHDSHGVIRIPRYVDWALAGDLVPGQTLTRLVDAPSFAVVDGNYGFGPTVAPQAVDLGIEKAKATGLAAIALRNSGHLGRVGQWAERAAAEGLVSIHFVNAASSVLVAPFGALERRFSTAPFCVGIPRPDAPPVMLDFATSIVAEGKIAVASQGGKVLRADALIGPDGEPSNDPGLFYGPTAPDGSRNYNLGKAAIRAFGEHKGSGLALVCELLGGALTGTGASSPERKRFANGMFSLYLDSACFDPAHLFDAEVARYVEWVLSAKPIPGERVMTPGEPERATREERTANGLPITPGTLASIAAAASKVGVLRGLQS